MAGDSNRGSVGAAGLRVAPETETLALLVTQAFFVGLAFGLLYNIAYTLLVYEYGSAGLRIVYVLVGVVVPLVTFGFNALEERLPLSRFSLVTMASLTAAIFLLYLLTFIPNDSWIPFVLMLLNTMGSLYCMMLRGAQASEIYDARALKRNYPRITGGEIFAVVIAGIVAAPLAEVLGSLERVILVAGVAMVSAVVVAQRIGSTLLEPLERAHGGVDHELGSAHEHRGLSAVRAIIAKRYSLIVFGYQLAGSAGSLLVQYLVYSEAQQFFATQTELSRFIGLVKSGTTGLGFLFLTLIAGRLLVKFGMPVGVAGSPIGVGALLAAALITGALDDGSGRSFFVLIVVAQFVDYTLYSGFTKTSVQSAFQPLPAHEREAVHTFVQGVGIPLSYGVTGLLLMGFARFPGFATVHAVYLTLGVAVVSGALGRLLYRGYGSALRSSLSRRHIDAVKFTLEDASTLEIVESLFESNDVSRIRSGLELLEEAAHPSYEHRLEQLTDHPSPEVRSDVYERIEARAPDWARPVLIKAVDTDPNDSARAGAIRALCAVLDDPTPTVRRHLAEAAPTVRAAAVTGLFLYGGINGVLQAGEVFNRLVISPQAEERADAAEILARVGIRNFYHPLHTLLADSDQRVITAALRAARRIAHPALIEDILPWIEPAATRAEAIAALSALGSDVTPLLERCLNGSSQLPRSTVLRVVRAASRAHGDEVVQALESALEHPDPEIAFAVYTALSRRNYAAGDETHPTVERLLHNYTQKAARAVMAIHELGRDRRLQALNSALDDVYTQDLEAVFLLLTFLHDPDEIMGIRRRIVQGGAKERALGIELLEVELSGPLKHRLPAVAEHPENQPPDPTSYNELFGIKPMGRSERVREIREDRNFWPESWLRTCAEYAAYRLGDDADPPEDNMLTIIERVITLKSADIFSSIPDSVLAHIAAVAQDFEVSAKQTFIRQGELGTCMYIIRTGRVAIHDEQTRFAELGSGRVVGEMAVLDPEPRSASVTALEDSSLLRIEKDAFESVMVDHPDIAQAVIQVLCRRLRDMLKKEE